MQPAAISSMSCALCIGETAAGQTIEVAPLIFVAAGFGLQDRDIKACSSFMRFEDRQTLLNHIWLSFRGAQVERIGTVAWAITLVKFAEVRCHSNVKGASSTSMAGRRRDLP